MSIQYIRGSFIIQTPLGNDDSFYDASLNGDRLISRVQKTNNVTPPIVANRFALSCIVQGDGIAWINLGTVAVPAWGVIGTVLNLTRVLTPAEVNAIGTNPITLVPAPGPDLLIVPTILTVKNDFVSTPYAGTPTDLSLRFFNGSSLSVVAAASSSLLLSASTIKLNLGTPAGSGSTVNSDRSITVSNVTGVNPTAGDSPITIYMEYKIIAF